MEQPASDLGVEWRLIAAETFTGGVDMDPVGLDPVRARAIPRVPRGVISALLRVWGSLVLVPYPGFCVSQTAC